MTLGSLGFSFIEVGTFTPSPQKGNKYPRIKRMLKEESLINRLGFNNPGIQKGIQNIKKIKKTFKAFLELVLENKDTNLDDAYKDYIFCLDQCFMYADYVAINISSPNTSKLRSSLQQAILITLQKK